MAVVAAREVQVELLLVAGVVAVPEAQAFAVAVVRAAQTYAPAPVVVVVAAQVVALGKVALPTHSSTTGTQLHY